MSKPIRTLLFGLGAFGTGIGRLAAERDDIKLVGSIQGDLATSAAVLNCVPGVAEHAPGLITMLDLPVPAGRGVTP